MKSSTPKSKPCYASNRTGWRAVRRPPRRGNRLCSSRHLLCGACRRGRRGGGGQPANLLLCCASSESCTGASDRFPRGTARPPARCEPRRDRFAWPGGDASFAATAATAQVTARPATTGAGRHRRGSHPRPEPDWHGGSSRCAPGGHHGGAQRPQHPRPQTRRHVRSLAMNWVGLVV